MVKLSNNYRRAIKIVHWPTTSDSSVSAFKKGYLMALIRMATDTINHSTNVEQILKADDDLKILSRFKRKYCGI